MGSELRHLPLYTDVSTIKERDYDPKAEAELISQQFKVVSCIKLCSKRLPCRVDASEVEKAGQGFVLKAHPDAQVTSKAMKMSKSRGNVINPDDIVHSFGADSLRLYEMFMGPLRETKASHYFCATLPSHPRMPTLLKLDSRSILLFDSYTALQETYHQFLLGFI